jgi:transaldolase
MSSTGQNAMSIADQKRGTKLNQLEQIKKFTTVVADTADFESIRRFKPQDATTNPSLVYMATQKENYIHFIEEVLAKRRNSGLGGATVGHLDPPNTIRQRNVGSCPGRVSTETDVRYSFDVEGSIRKARHDPALQEQGWARACADSLPPGRGFWPRSNCRRKKSNAT